MRQIQINIYARPGTSDNEVLIVPGFTDVDNIYQFSNMVLNYSIQSSVVTGTLMMSMNTTPSKDNVIRSGQPISISDNGKTIFQGVILTPNYQLMPMSETSAGGIFFVATIAPSIFQLTMTPMIFDNVQATQISSLTKVDVNAILAAGVTQQITKDALLSYIVSNTDYNSFFDRTIEAQNLPDNMYLMATTGQSRDSVLRSTIDFANVVMYQREDGLIQIKQLDTEVVAPFSLDLSNGSLGTTQDNNVAMLQYDYQENAAMTPSIVSNYAILASDVSVSGNVTENLLSFKPSNQFFPRVNQLQQTGWFVGQLGNTQINQNIISDPALASILAGYQNYQNQFMDSSKQIGAKSDFLSAYQAMLTGKQLGQALTNYSSLQCTISLDDPYLPDFDSILGYCVDIQNCDMEKGLIATYSRTYSAYGSYLNLNIIPLGSLTGYWLTGL